MARRRLIAIAGLALVLHGLGMARSVIPAQDGLKFIRFARDYHTLPWGDVVRKSDQHPLYSALIAVAEPFVALFLGETPTAWRVAAQLVSALAAVATIFPLFGFSRALFGERAALVATFVYVLLPVPAAISRDTLSESLFLFFFIVSLRLGEVALRTARPAAWVGAGLAAGVGYLVRPEILVVPAAIALTALSTRIRAPKLAVAAPPGWLRRNVAAMGVACLVIVGMYALVKGEVTEKLSMRLGLGVGVENHATKATPPIMVPGLDEAAVDLSPKEESAEAKIRGSAKRASLRLVQQCAEGLGWIMLPFAAWGVVRGASLGGSAVGRRLVGCYLAMFAGVVIWHATRQGYLSGRHALTIVIATTPWVGAGIVSWFQGLPERRGLRPETSRRLAIAGLALLFAIGVTVQVKAMHPTRWGHWAAGRWLVDHADADDSVLDTRGWATFVRGVPTRGFDYWHVRQALNEPTLKYVVVGVDELKARSRRAATLRAMLAFAATPVAEFPDREGERGVGVQVYRLDRPDSWAGMRP